MKKVLLVGYFGYGNPGDEVSLFLTKRELVRWKIPHRTFFADGTASAYRRLLSVRKYLADSSALLFCGGNLLQNETGNLSLIYYLYVIRAAIALGVPVFFSSGGIGKIRGAVANYITKEALRDVAFFGARTFFDYNQLQFARMKHKIYMPDVCFTLPQRVEKKRDIFAYIPKSRNKETEEKIRSISHSAHLTPIIIPFQSSCDLEICKAVSKALDAPIVTADSYQKLSGVLSACRFTVSERLHGGIFSLISHTPTFLPSECVKCRALVDDIKSLSRCLGITSPLYTIPSLREGKIKELGALDSEFDIILNNLRLSSRGGLSRLCELLKSQVRL